jgi:hypothetical protein
MVLEFSAYGDRTEGGRAVAVGIKGIIEPHGGVFFDVLTESVQGRFTRNQARVVTGLPEVGAGCVLEMVDSTGSGRFKGTNDVAHWPVISG